MRWGRVEATGGFFLLVAWMNYWDSQGLVPMALLACTLHELGHLGMIRAVGGRVRLIRLTAVGAEMAVDRPLGYWQEGAAALAGPGVNLLLALVFCCWSWGRTFAGLNLALAIFNLIPIGSLDGGRTLYCALSLLTGPDWARRMGETLDLICAGALLGMGVLLAGTVGNITMLLAALWIIGMIFRGKSHHSPAIRTCHQGRKPVKLKVRL